ncbi:hypothetical protein AMTR_s00003p00246220 [Amborella trichopoda]|uniref:Uncharacterized protein n=1 Tax=Amborella trichopoda TaxID=13333 RepID=W1P6Y5_AMBTC|nr:hypothetical protein AMTR_s00003p00246220 [Amborella trichopoda]
MGRPLEEGKSAFGGSANGPSRSALMWPMKSTISLRPLDLRFARKKVKLMRASRWPGKSIPITLITLRVSPRATSKALVESESSEGRTRVPRGSPPEQAREGEKGQLPGARGKGDPSGQREVEISPPARGTRGKGRGKGRGKRGGWPG